MSMLICFAEDYIYDAFNDFRNPTCPTYYLYQLRDSVKDIAHELKRARNRARTVPKRCKLTSLLTLANSFITASTKRLEKELIYG